MNGASHPWAHAPCLVCSLILIVVIPHGCVYGVVQPLLSTHVFEGRRVLSLGMLPIFPSLAQVKYNSSSIILRKLRCIPLCCCTSPSCAQGAPTHSQISSFAQLIASSLCSSSISSLNLPKERTHSVGVMGDLTSPTS
jgi:hypothetical protein